MCRAGVSLLTKVNSVVGQKIPAAGTTDSSKAGRKGTLFTKAAAQLNPEAFVEAAKKKTAKGKSVLQGAIAQQQSGNLG